MAASGSFKVTIGIIDSITKPLDAINKRIEAAQAPVKRMHASMDKFSKLTGLDQVGNGFREMGRLASNALTPLTSMLPVLGTLTGAASIAGVLKLASAWGDVGLHLSNAANILGTSTGRLQELESIARLAGISVQSMDASLQGLGDAMQAAVTGRAPELSLLLSQTGENVTKAGWQAMSGAEKFEMAMRIIKKSQDQHDSDATTRKKAHMLGLTDDMIPLASKWAETQARQRKFNSPLSDIDVKNAVAFGDSIRDVEEALHGMANTIMSALGPALTPLLEEFATWLSNNRELVKLKVGEWASDLAAWIKTLDFKAIAQDIKDFGTKVSEVATDIDKIVTQLGGWKEASEILFAVWATANAIGMITRIGAMVGFLTNPVFLAAMATLAGFKAAYSEGKKAASNNEMATDLGYTESFAPGSRDDQGNSLYYLDKEGKQVWVDPISGKDSLKDRYQKEKPHGEPGAQYHTPAALQKGSHEAYQDYIDHGFSPSAAAGMAAQEEQESSFNPKARGDYVNGTATAGGLYQMHKDRRDAIMKAKGIDMWNDSAEKQREGIRYEMIQGNEKPAGQAVMGARTPFEGGYLGSRKLERPGRDEATKEAEGQRRGKMAQATYDRENAILATKPMAPEPSKVDVGVHFSGNVPANTKLNAQSNGPGVNGAPKISLPMTGFGHAA